MSFKKNISVESLSIDGVLVGTASGQVRSNSNTFKALSALGSLYEERQITRRCGELAAILMKELELPQGKTIVGLLCCGVARSNYDEVRGWVLTETAKCTGVDELHDPELINELTRKLYYILMEYSYDD